MTSQNLKNLENLIRSTVYEIYYNDVTLMSFINIKYSNVAGKSIPKDLHSGIGFLQAKGLGQMLFTLRCI